MSRDITIVILKTQSRDVDGYEFRVFETTTTNFGYNADYPRNKPVLNRYFLLERHSRAPIFFDEMEAWGYAADHLRRNLDAVVSEYVEFGVCLYDYGDVYFPASDTKRRRREKFQQHGASVAKNPSVMSPEAQIAALRTAIKKEGLEIPEEEITNIIATAPA